MRIPDAPTLRVLTFEPEQGSESVDSRLTGLASARQLLSDLGHSVTESQTLGEMASALSEEGTVDLFLADVRTDAEAQDVSTVLGGVSVQDRPLHVVLVTTISTLNPAQLRKHLRPAHLHVLPQPIHLHGLLHVVRQLEKGTQMA